MPKRLLAILAPVIAVVALAAVPAVSQAAPHYYRNGVLIPEGTKVPVLEWGRLNLEPEPRLTGGQTCASVAGGYVENPEDGGAGIGAIEDLATYDCEFYECPAGTIEVGGKPEEKVSQVISLPQDPTWPTALTEPEAGKIRTDIAKVVMQVGCFARPLTRTEGELGKTTGPGENELLPLASTVTCVTAAEHELAPLDENGAGAATPSKLVFGAKAGSLSCDGGAYEMVPVRSLKVIGYTGSELITVKNP